MTETGWLFDLYPEGKGMRLWFIDENGTAVSLWDRYAPSFYVRSDLRALEAALRGLSVRPAELSVAPVERVDLMTGKAVRVLEVSVSEPGRYAQIVNALDRWNDGTLELFSCDIPPAQRYCYDRDIFPLAFCACESEAGVLRSLRLRDDPWTESYRIPPLSVLELKVEGDPINPRHGHRGHLEAKWEGETRILNGDDPALLLESLSGLLERADPDVILTQWGDAWLFPQLHRLARIHGKPLPWNRDPNADPRSRRARSYVSYGRIVRREASRTLSGRWHLDARNTFILAETGLEGLIELARLSRIPVQQLARTSTGTAINSMELLQACRDGILIPWRKQEPEGFKTAGELLVADKGGLVFLPEPGIHGDVAELDFASLYPTLMSRYNISPETLDCPCCPGNRVPEIGRHTCTRRRGLVPRVLEPILEKRARYKALRKAARTPEEHRLYDRRQNALKWILVVSFGYLGYKNARFGRIEAHEAVTAYSREMLLRAKEIAESKGFRLVHAIVDAIWVYRSGITEAQALGLADAIGRETGITMALEGIYRWLIFPPSRIHGSLAVANRYAGLFRSGSVKARGLEFRRHDTPPFIAQTQETLLEILAKARSPAELHDRLPEALELLGARAMELIEGRVPLPALAITRQISRRPEEYTRACDTAIAAQSLLARGVRLSPGESVQMIITASKDPDPASRIRPLAMTGSAPTSYDREKYLDLLIRAAGTLLGPLGYDEDRLKIILKTGNSLNNS
jgi:DNA polymerase-2